MLDIGVIIPKLSSYGGAERLAVECMARWQHAHRVTIYSTKFNSQLLREHGIDLKAVRCVSLTAIESERHHSVLHCVLEPKLWELEVGEHDVYLGHQWPTHLVDRHPFVWFPHEPCRAINDGRYERSVDHLASRLIKDVAQFSTSHASSVLDRGNVASLRAMQQFEQTGNPDRLVANSRYSAGYLEAVYGRKVTDVVYPGVDADRFLQMPPAEDLFLAVGRPTAGKRLRPILEALRDVQGAELTIAGVSASSDQLMKMLERLGITERVYFLPEPTNEELIALYARCLGVVFTPIREPFGIVALEAMAAGKPLIAVNEGGYTEVVDESCAFLVPPHPGELAEKMRFLVDNKDVASRMGEAGREKARHYSWDRTATELLAILKEAAGHKPEAQAKETHVVARSPDHSTTSLALQACVERSSRSMIDAAAGPLFGATYLSWYGQGYGAAHWNDKPENGVTDMPALGYYPSHQGVIIEAHLRDLRHAGFDFVAFNLHIDSEGVNGYELAAVDHLFGVAERAGSPLRLAARLMLEHPQQQDLKHVLGALRNVFARKPGYLHQEGRPLLLVDPGNPERCPPLISRWLGKYADGFNAAMELGSAGLKVQRIQPGCDTEHLPADRQFEPSCDRRDGKTYKARFEQLVSSETLPDIVLIDSYNDYHHNTHIEPSHRHGVAYLELTRTMIQAVRARWNSQAENSLRTAA